MTENCNIYSEDCENCPPCASFIEIDTDISIEKIMKRLIATRAERGMSDGFAASQLGIKKSELQNYESGSREMPLDIFFKYCRLIGLDINSMWRQS